jgi:hypothetical protein
MTEAREPETEAGRRVQRWIVEDNYTSDAAVLDAILAIEREAAEKALHSAARIIATVSLPRGSGAQVTRRFLLGLLDDAILEGASE